MVIDSDLGPIGRGANLCPVLAVVTGSGLQGLSGFTTVKGYMILDEHTIYGINCI